VTWLNVEREPVDVYRLAAETRLANCSAAAALMREEVLVRVHREAGVGVAKAFGDDLDRHPVGDEQRGMCVAQVVEADPRQARALHDPVQQLAERLGVEEPSGAVTEQPVVRAPRCSTRGRRW
jgi:hypothetical protein